MGPRSREKSKTWSLDGKENGGRNNEEGVLVKVEARASSEMPSQRWQPDSQVKVSN